jgi:hypothetical protein
MSKVSLIIFTCEDREHLLKRTYASFLASCDYKFDQVILAVDGVIDQSVIADINPDLVVYTYKRKGYVISIRNTLSNITGEFFFWLEDDWDFHFKVDVPHYVNLLNQHQDWAQVIYSKYGPLTDEFKINKAGDDLYENINGFSTNPGFNRTRFVRDGYDNLDQSKQQFSSQEWGHEDLIKFYLAEKGLRYVLIDPVDHTSISHEGYLESTPRNWHMISSLDKKTEKHLLTIPTPSLARRLFMIAKLSRAFISLAFRQLWNNEIYELCFRVIALNIVTKKNARSATDHNHSNG